MTTDISAFLAVIMMVFLGVLIVRIFRELGKATPALWAIGKIDLSPGDILAVKLNKRDSMYEKDRLYEYLKRQLPDGTRIIMLRGPIELSVIRGGNVSD